MPTREGQPVMEIDEALVDWVARDPTQPAWALDEVARDAAHALRPALERALASVPENAIEGYLTDPVRSWFLEGYDQLAARRKVQFDLACEAIEATIFDRRVRALCGLDGKEPPLPYPHAALDGLVADGECLVPISGFQSNTPGLSRRGFVFHVPPTLRQANSSYWLALRLPHLPQTCGIRVRLDPFIVCPEDDYHPAFYAMLTYGQPLDWDRLASLREEEHAEWAPDTLTTAGGVTCTQVCWSPRDDGVHFTCEELPAQAAARPARYAHAIYDPTTGVFTHADLAARYYSERGLSLRRDTHVRKAAKVGRRVKVLRVDGHLPRDEWCELMAAFFVWNQDIQDYFHGNRDLER